MRIVAGGCLSGLLLLGGASAVAVDGLLLASHDNLENIIVTASGRAEGNLEAPLTIDTVDGDSAEKDNASWIGETMNRMPGVFFSQLRGPADAPAIRQPISFNNVYLFLQDGVPLQSPVSFNHGAFAYSGALTSFGGIEVLKGPGSALHGSDAMAAVVNVRSRKPEFENSGTLGLRIGEYGLVDTRIEVDAKLDESHAMLWAFSDQRDDNWRDNTAWERQQQILRHRYRGDNDTEINTILLYTDFDSRMSAPVSAAQLVVDPAQDGLAPDVNRDEARSPTTYLRLSSEISHALDRLRIQITPYYREIDDRYMAIWQPATTPNTTSATETAGLLNRLYIAVSDSSEWILGFDIESTQLKRRTEQTRPTQNVFGTNYPQGVHLDHEVDYLSLAPYFQYTQHLGARWIVVAGLRYEDSHYQFRNNLGAADVDPGHPYLVLNNREDSFEQSNPKLGLTYLIDDHQSIYARYARGFRIPGEGELYVLNPSQTEFTLKPEKIDSLEIGYKAWLHEGWRVNAAIYRMKTSDGIVAGITTPAGDISANGGRARYDGIELGIGAVLPAGFEAELALAFTDFIYERKLAQGSDPADGKQIPGSPDTLANLRVAHNTVFGLRSEIEIQYLGAWYMNETNTLKTDPETIFNLRLEYNFNDAFSIDLKILNLFDEDHVMTAEAPVWAPNGQFRPGAPRIISAGFVYRF